MVVRDTHRAVRILLVVLLLFVGMAVSGCGGSRAAAAGDVIGFDNGASVTVPDSFSGEFITASVISSRGPSGSRQSLDLKSADDDAAGVTLVAPQLFDSIHAAMLRKTNLVRASFITTDGVKVVAFVPAKTAASMPVTILVPDDGKDSLWITVWTSNTDQDVASGLGAEAVARRALEWLTLRFH